MTTAQLVTHYVFMTWFSWTTFCRVVMVNKSHHPIVRYALSAMACCCVVGLLAPIWLSLNSNSDPLFSNTVPAANMLWLYITMTGVGAFNQTVFAAYWMTGQAQQIFRQENAVQVVLDRMWLAKRAK